MNRRVREVLQPMQELGPNLLGNLVSRFNRQRRVDRDIDLCVKPMPRPPDADLRVMSSPGRTAPSRSVGTRRNIAGRFRIRSRSVAREVRGQIVAVQGIK